MALGPGLLSPITENAAGSYDILGQKVFLIDSNCLFAAKILCIITMFAECFLYSMNTFISLEKINQILMHDRRNMG